LTELQENPVHYDELEEKTTYLFTGLKDIFSSYNVTAQLNRVASMMSIFFTEEEVIDFDTANTTNQELFRAFFHEMLKNGIYLPPSPFETFFLANSLTNEHLDQTIEAAGQSIKTGLEKV
jgi:glutamate-1-semialdehyde 2,1-aminomutase